MNTKIFYSVNSSLYFSDEHVNLLVDGIHGGIESGMSAMSEDTKKQMFMKEGTFSNLHLLLFTHFHPDHYNRGQVELFLKQTETTDIFGPGFEHNTLSCSCHDEDYCFINYKGVKLSAVSTTHQGDAYKDETNCTYLLDFGDKCFFVGGDALLGEREYQVIHKHNKKPIDLAFINPCQAVHHGCREFLEKLSPKKVAIYHMPYQKDDIYNYGSLAKQAIRLYQDTGIDIEMISCGQWIED